MRKYLLEVEKRLLALEKAHKPEKWLAKNYIGGGMSKLKFLDIKIPLVRAAYKQGFSFSHLPPEHQWPIWNYIWNKSDIFEVMLIPSYWAASRPVEEVFAHRKFILGWLTRVDNWAHSDEMSNHYAKLLEDFPRQLMPIFKKWNASKNPWFKRQSMVGLMYYSRMRKKAPSVDVILNFVERHIEDDHYYVQKAVGWALRESWNVYPKQTFAYLKKNAHRIPPGGWTAATEKLDSKQKSLLSEIRRAKRVR